MGILRLRALLAARSIHCAQDEHFKESAPGLFRRRMTPVIPLKLQKRQAKLKVQPLEFLHSCPDEEFHVCPGRSAVSSFDANIHFS
jgi:hypothetical protein